MRRGRAASSNLSLDLTEPDSLIDLTRICHSDTEVGRYDSAIRIGYLNSDRIDTFGAERAGQNSRVCQSQASRQGT